MLMLMLQTKDSCGSTADMHTQKSGVELAVRLHLQLRHKLSDKVPIRVILLPKSHRAVHPVVLVEESACREPHPVGVVQAPVIVYEEAIKHVSACCPGAVEVPARQEACNCMPGEMVHPALHTMQVSYGKVRRRSHLLSCQHAYGYTSFTFQYFVQ